MSTILKSMELINSNNKTWRIEIEGESEESRTTIIRTCFNHGRTTEKVVEGTRYDRNKQYIQKIMGQLRKGYRYRNLDANKWEPCFHGYVGRGYTGFMPIAASKTRSDFYLIRVKGDFEDEILFHYDENGNLLDQDRLGAKRLTYRAHMDDDSSLILHSLIHLEKIFEVYDPDTKRLERIEDDRITHLFDQKDDHSDISNGIRVDYIGYEAPSARGYFDITDTEKDERIIRIFNEFTVQNAFCAFTSNRLIVHTDYGVLSIYNI